MRHTSLDQIVRTGLCAAVLGASAWLSTPAPVQAQATGSISGVVLTEATGRPLESAQVYIEGTSRGALANAAGRFLILSVPVGTHTVVSELVGYRTVRQEVTVQADQAATVELRMAVTALALDEIVVTGAGIATEKKRLGNSVGTIDVSELEDRPIPDFSSLIQGREAGVVGLPSSGSTGEGSRIRIRGSASLSQLNEPIVYVDGVRIDRGGGFGPGVSAGGQGSPSRLDDIDPGSIERVEILKGAAAATLYGTEASNGVIQIFTKRGRAGAPVWTFQMDQGFIDTPTGRMIPHADYARDQDQVDAIRSLWGQSVGLYEPFQVDILPQFFETGRSQAYSASVSGGGDLITYYVSGRWTDEDGPLGLEELVRARDTNEKRQATANLSIFPHEDVRIKVSALYSEVDHETPSNSNNIFGFFSSGLMSQPRLATENNIFGAPAFATTVENGQEVISQEAEHFAGSVNTRWDIREGLMVDGTFGVDVTNQRSTDFFPFGWNVDGFSTFFTDGLRDISDRNHKEVTADLKANWNTTLSDEISSALLIGAQGFVTQTTSSGGEGENFPGPGLEVIGAASDVTIFENYLRVVNAGVYFQEQLGFRDHTFLTVGARWDANSAFGEDFEGVLYPKASLSVIPSDFGSWDRGGLLSTMRVRAAIGQSGLQPGAFDKFTTFSSLSSSDGPGLAPDNLGNQALEPEVATEWEVGTEMGLFDDRVGLDVTYWNRTVSDALVARQFPVTGGFMATQLDNIGEVKAWGLELGLNGSAYQGRDVEVNLFASVGYLDEEVTSLGDAPPLKVGGSYPRYRNFIREGYAPGAFFGAALADVDIPLNLNGDCTEPSRDAALAYFSEPRSLDDFEVLAVGADGGLASVGCGDSFLDSYLGKPTPDWSGSFGMDVTFLEHFNLSSMFEFKAGDFHVQDLSGAFRQANSVIGRNVPEAAEVGATLANPSSSSEDRLDAALLWAHELRALAPMSGMNQIHPADFVRWRELSLTWSLPEHLVDRMGLRSAALSGGVRNLKLWVNSEYKGMDPEVNVLGRCDGGLDCNFLNSVEGWGVPIPRRFTISARVSF